MFIDFAGGWQCFSWMVTGYLPSSRIVSMACFRTGLPGSLFSFDGLLFVLFQYIS